MADFLVYKGGHWADSAEAISRVQLQIINKNMSPVREARAFDLLQSKVNARFRRGELFSVHEPLSEAPAPNSVFVVLRVNGMSVEEAQNYIGKIESNGVVTKRLRYRIRWGDMSTSMQNQLRDNRYLVVTRTQFVNYMEDQA